MREVTWQHRTSQFANGYPETVTVGEQVSPARRVRFGYQKIENANAVDQLARLIGAEGG
jgi:hypothetical protein